MEAMDHRTVLDRYRRPKFFRSAWQLLSSVVLFGAFWTLAWLSLGHAYWLTLVLSVPTAGLLVRLFILQHDCGHGSFFRAKWLNDAVGCMLGVLVLTPYAYWRRQHALHHATSGDLDRRGMGDVHIATVAEYVNLPPLSQLWYRIYRNPVFFFGIAPVVYFAVLQRFTTGVPRSWNKERLSVHGTNLALLGCLIAAVWFIGLRPFLLVQLPVIVVASSIGAWLFYIQHNFEATYWQRHDRWDFATAGASGSSHYDLPKILQWFTANIGFHHIHHLDSRIPNYRLQECYDEHAEFRGANRLTLRQSLSCISLKLWDEEQGRMVGFRCVHEQMRAARMPSAADRLCNRSQCHVDAPS